MVGGIQPTSNTFGASCESWSSSAIVAFAAVCDSTGADFTALSAGLLIFPPWHFLCLKGIDVGRLNRIASIISPSIALVGNYRSNFLITKLVSKDCIAVPVRPSTTTPICSVISPVATGLPLIEGTLPEYLHHWLGDKQHNAPSKSLRLAP